MTKYKGCNYVNQLFMCTWLIIYKYITNAFYVFVVEEIKSNQDDETEESSFSPVPEETHQAGKYGKKDSYDYLPKLANTN